jgi:hypothetical protein
LITDETLTGADFVPSLDPAGLFKMTFSSRVGEDAILPFLEQTYDPESVSIEATLVMSGSSVLTDTLPATMDGFTTLDECDDTGYSRQTLANMDASAVAADKLCKLVPDAPSFANNGDAGTDIIAIVYSILVTDDTDSIPISVQQVFAKTLDGTAYVPPIPSTGIARMVASD